MTKFKKAHEMTKKIVEKYGDVNYAAQFALCLQSLKGDDEMDEMKVYVEKYEKGWLYEAGTEISTFDKYSSNAPIGTIMDEKAVLDIEECDILRETEKALQVQNTFDSIGEGLEEDMETNKFWIPKQYIIGTKAIVPKWFARKNEAGYNWYKLTATCEEELEALRNWLGQNA